MFGCVAVVAQGVAKGDVAYVLAFDEHVGLADGVGLGVEFLAKDGQARLGVVFGKVFACHTEHTAGASGGVVDGAHDAGLAQNIVILNKDEVDHETDDLTRREVLTRGFIADFSKFANELFKHQAHLHVAHALRVQINLGKLFCDLVEQTSFGQALNLNVELKALKHIAHSRREALHVAVEVLRDVVSVAQQLFEIQRRCVVEALPRFAQQEWFWVDTLFFFGSEL